MASLTVVSGPNENSYIPLRRVTVIGRDEAVMVQIKDELVSRRHCQIRFDPAKGDGDEGTYVLLDMKSANGTYVNGRKVDEVPLEDDDVIEIGESKLMFSTRDFEDRENALNHFKARGERAKGTILRPGS